MAQCDAKARQGNGKKAAVDNRLDAELFVGSNHPQPVCSAVCAKILMGVKLMEEKRTIGTVGVPLVELKVPGGDAIATSDFLAARYLVRHFFKPDGHSLAGGDFWAAGFVDHWVSLAEALVEKNTDGVEALETHVATKAFIVGEKLSLADIAMWAALKRTSFVLPSDKFANTTRWLASIDMHLRGTAGDDGTKLLCTAAKCQLQTPAASSQVSSASSAKSSTVEKKSGTATPALSNFIRQIIEEDLKSGKHSQIVTRFPPEPNGFLHLGHAKSICLNFGLARDFGGRCHLRFDDTNPTKEEHRYIESIQEDVRWLGGDWGSNLFYSSDYFQQLYDWAVQLIKDGYAYVDEQTEEEVRANRGDISTPGVNSPFRDRPVEESLDIFDRMRRGEVPEGKCIVRAKIDMSHGNMNLRDPPIYRVKFAPHPRTGSAWCVYPIYDFAHGQSDSIERITHSICTLEFEDHRPLYEWFQEKLGIFKTRQIEFARLNCTYTVMSKRKLLSLVSEGHVRDWDDPRMPTVAAMRRRGYSAAAIREFCNRVGVAKRDNMIQVELLESCIREALHATSPRRNVVMKPIKLVITNYPEDKDEEFLEASNHPEDESMGKRNITFGRELYIDKDDFMENPPPKFFRLAPGREVRLRYGYWVTCQDVLKDREGEVVAIRCTYDPATCGGNAPPDGRKVKGTIHWIHAKNAVDVEVRVYERLFNYPTPDDPPEGKTWRDLLTPESLKIVRAKAEPAVVETKLGDVVQFERVGFFAKDPDSTDTLPVFSLTVGLLDSWAAQTDEKSKEAQSKEAARIAREKAAAERQKKKEERERREAEKKAKATI